LIVEPSWQTLLDKIREEPQAGIIYVVGANDSGKSTLCHFLATHLSEIHPTAYIDCDPGQSLVGPPTTIGLKIPFHSSNSPSKTYLYFVGSTTPRGHLLQTLVGIKKLTELAQTLGSHWIILDSSGFVLDPVAREFQFRVIDLVQPRFLIVLKKSDDDLRWVHGFKNHPVVRLLYPTPSTAIVPRTPIMRKNYREQKFKLYFEAATLMDIPLKGISFHGRIPNLRDPARHRFLLVACCDANNLVVALAIIESIDLPNKMIRVYAPKFDLNQIMFIQFGSIYLNLEGQQIFPWRIQTLLDPADQSPNTKSGD